LLLALPQECSNRTPAPSTSEYLGRERPLQFDSEDRRPVAMPSSAPDRSAHTQHPSGKLVLAALFLHVGLDSARTYSVTLTPNAWFTSSIARSKIEDQFFMMTPSTRVFSGDEEDYCSFGLLATDFVECVVIATCTSGRSRV